MTRKPSKSLWFTLTLAVLVYVAISHLVYALRHPELTDTQRLFNFLDALLWR